MASILIVRGAAHAAAAAGVDRARLARAIGLRPEVLDDPEARVPLEVANGAWVAAADLSGDPDFGLHAAERMEEEVLGVVEYLGRSSATVGEALRRIAEYLPLLVEPSELGVAVSDGVAHFAVHADHLPRPVAEFALAMLALRVRQFAGDDLDPQAVAFAHPEPADTSEYRRIFRAPVRFGQPLVELLFEAAVLDRPLRSAEPQLSYILERHAQEMLARVAPQEPFLSRAYQALAQGLPRGRTGLDDLARALALSRRTLQRRLREAGTTHEALLDHLRRQLALHWVGEGRLAIGEVAFRLGYSDPASFHRAFRRWTGTTPMRHARSR
jgi:AraC-like DNA-binding protein